MGRDDMDQAIDRHVLDEARRGRVEAPHRDIVTEWARDVIVGFALVSLAVIGIAALSARDRMRNGESPAVEALTVIGLIVVFVAMVVLYRRTRPR